jgi:hypothetical protein
VSRTRIILYLYLLYRHTQSILTLCICNTNFFIDSTLSRRGALCPTTSKLGTSGLARSLAISIARSGGGRFLFVADCRRCARTCARTGRATSIRGRCWHLEPCYGLIQYIHNSMIGRRTLWWLSSTTWPCASLNNGYLTLAPNTKSGSTLPNPIPFCQWGKEVHDCLRLKGGRIKAVSTIKVSPRVSEGIGFDVASYPSRIESHIMMLATIFELNLANQATRE